MDHLTFPLHPAQWDVYTDQLLNVESPHYNIGGYIKLKGPLNKAKFQEAVCNAPKIFDVFRMRFDANLSESPCYYDQDYDRCEMPELDFSDRENPEAKAIEWMQSRFNTAFVIHKDSLLFEHFILKISESEHWAFGRYHHLIIDGYGFIAWAQYVSLKYKSLIAEDNVAFTYPSYREESRNASAYYQSEDYEAAGRYWKEKITAKPTRLFQKKHIFQNTSGKKSSTFTLRFDESERNELEDIQTTTKSGLQQLTIAALLIYFGKTSEQTEYLIGTPVHKRVSRQLRKTIGMFAGILPYKGHFPKDVRLGDFIRDITQTQKRDYRHQHYLIGDLSRHLKLNSADGYLCEVMVNSELLNFDLNFGDDIQSTICRLLNEYEVEPLQISWQDYGSDQPLQLQVHFLYDYFTLEEVELLVKRILFILRQFPKSINQNLESIDILPPAEKMLLESFNKTAQDYFPHRSIVDLFEEQAETNPHSIAVVFEDKALTYAELNMQSNQLAHYLIGRGVTAESLVPICMERSPEMIVGLLAILKAGGAYVPIDSTYPEDRIAYMLNDTKGNLVITSNKSRTEIPVIDGIEIIELDSEWQNIRLLSNRNPNVVLLPDQLAYVIYTSGSTGKPKGVMIEHRNVYSFIRWCQQEFASSDFEIVYAATSICFDLSVYEIFYTLSVGKRLRILENGLSIDHYLPGDSKVLTNSVPTVVQHLLAERVDLGNISVMNMAGEPIPFQVHQGIDSSRIEIRNLYGPTEDTTYSTVYRLQNGGPILIGRPITNTRVYIVNKDLEAVPVGVTGEIFIGGAGLARGYLNRPDLTNEKFIQNPFSNDPSERIYKTGDLGRWLSDGNIDYQGRIDDQVKIRGYRVELGEIEHVLQQSALVKEAVVIAHEQKEGGKQLVGYIVPNSSAQQSKERELYNRHDSNSNDGAGQPYEKNELLQKDVKSWLQLHLPDYMIPGVIVVLDELPLTPNGKIDKKALPPPGAGDRTTNEYVAPRNLFESKVADIWKEVLEIDRVGIYDNFFDLGGHSLKAIQLISRLQKRLSIKTDMAKILANPTINELSRVLELEKPGSFNAIPRLPKQEHYELSHAQKRIWVISYFKDGSTVYNAPGAYIIKGNLVVDAFKRAFDMLIERHESLRTVFQLIDNEPRQKILSPVETGFTIEEIDLRKQPDSGKTIKNWLETDARQPFDLEKGPLMRVTLFRTENDIYVLAFNIHHIISDGWSKGILIREFMQVYHDLVAGVEIELSPLPVQYKDYAAWHAESFAGQQDYWKQLYEKDIPRLNFPTDHERPRVLSFEGTMLNVLVTEELTQLLRQRATRQGTTLNNLLFALYGLLIAKHTRQQEMVIGSLVSGRSHADLESLVGVFINFLPIRLTPAKRLSFNEYLGLSHHTLTAAYSNQDYPFDLMVDRFVKKRDVSRNPFFDTMVNFHSENDLQENFQFRGRKSPTGITVTPMQVLKKDFFQSGLDFKLDVEIDEKKLLLNLSFNSKLFSENRMEAFLQEYIELLSMATGQPDFKLAEYFGPDPVKDKAATEEAEESTSLASLSVNICASFVADPLQEYIEYWSNELNLKVNVAFTPYNQVFQQLLNTGSMLHTNSGLNILFIRVADWLRDHNGVSSAELIAILRRTYSEFIEAIEFAHKNTFVPFLVAIVPLRSSHPFSSEVARQIGQLNQSFENFIEKLPRFYLFDLLKVASLYSIEELFDDKSDELGHIPFSQEYYAAIGTYIMRKIRAYKGHVYKVIVLDCDNTLWKGVVGETGALNVVIDDNYAYLQEFVLEKYNQGFLIALCSKNNEDDVWEVFDNHPDMRLKREHIAASRINWDPKPGNLVVIANELNVGLNSLVFIDDSEFEVEQVTSGCPDVLSLVLPEDEPESFSAFINHIWALDHFQVTEEDVKRNSMYKAERQRKEEQVKYSSLNNFLQSLDIKVNIRPLEEKDLDRAVQLTLRTNQFNLNGIRKNPEEIARSIRLQNAVNWIIEVKDRFGDYGVTGLLLARKSQQTLVLETFLLSCRVLGRNVEEIILQELKNYCIVHGLDNVLALYQQTSKNKPISNFLMSSNWHLDSQTNNYSLFIKSTEHELLLK